MSSDTPSVRRSGRRRTLMVLGGVVVVIAVALAVAIPVIVTNNNNNNGDNQQEKSATTTLVTGGVGSDDDEPTSTTLAPSIVTTTTTPTPLPTLTPTLPETSTPPTAEPTNAVTAEPTLSSVTTVSPTMPPTTAEPTDAPTVPPTQSSTTNSLASDPAPGQNVFGVAGGVAYVHCQPTSTPNPSAAHIVLLHGSSFTKDDWLDPRRKIFENFCRDVSVTALDLSVSSGNEALRNVLNALQQQAQVIQLPVTLVTPSASGQTMTDWMTNGEVQLIPSYVSSWVPVATPSLRSVSDENVASIDGLVAVLAIRGNDDTAASRYMKRLEELASATMVELIGGHAPYLKSPDEFVETILVFEGIRSAAA